MNELLLADWAGLNIHEYLELPLPWVARLEELHYQSHNQDVPLFRRDYHR